IKCPGTAAPAPAVHTNAFPPVEVASTFSPSSSSSSHIFDMLARLQPLRCFHLITILFLLFLGGVVGEYAVNIGRWVLPCLCMAVSLLMFSVERQTYPASMHIEWPWLKTSPNAWVNTLLWVRHNTPRDAVFAVDSRYFDDSGVDKHGFRAISRRSALADYY